MPNNELDLTQGTGRRFASVADPVDDRQTFSVRNVGGHGIRSIESNSYSSIELGDCEEVYDALRACELNSGELQQENDELNDAIINDDGVVLQYQVSHIGDKRESLNRFVWNFFNRYLVVMSTPGNGFTDISQTTIYSYVTYTEIVETPYPPSSTGIALNFRAQKLDGTWVGGSGGGNWGIAFMQATTVGSYVPIQISLSSGGIPDVVVDTGWFDVGGYTFMGVVGGQNILQYTSSGLTSRDERDGI